MSGPKRRRKRRPTERRRGRRCASTCGCTTSGSAIVCCCACRRRTASGGCSSTAATTRRARASSPTRSWSKQIKRGSGRRKPLNVVIATHRHQDHISGFGETQLWQDIAVDEVWLPFTADETPGDGDPTPHAWRALMDAAHGLLDDRGKLTPQAMAALDARDDQDKAGVEFMLWNARANAPGIDEPAAWHEGGGRPAGEAAFPARGQDRLPVVVRDTCAARREDPRPGSTVRSAVPQAAQGPSQLGRQRNAVCRRHRRGRLAVPRRVADRGRAPASDPPRSTTPC